MKSLKTFLFAAGAVLVSTSAHAIDGDPAAGEQVFRTCSTCHNVEEERNKVGPHLVNVIGRTPGTVEGFRYSKAMTEFGESGAVWEEVILGLDPSVRVNLNVSARQLAVPGFADEALAIARAHGGDLTGHSDGPGHGATFALALPTVTS